MKPRTARRARRRGLLSVCRVLLAGAALLATVSMPSPGWGGETSVGELPILTRMFPPLQEGMKPLDPFFRDTDLVLQLRTFYRLLENPNRTTSEAWAAGGRLTYRSGWWLDTFQIGAALYTSQPLYAPEDRDGTSLLAPGQEGYTALGLAYAALRYKAYAVLTGYHQEVDTPYVNPQDDRMAPNTFEGVTLSGKAPHVDYTLGYLTQLKPRNENQFLSFGEVAGVKGGDQELLLAGLRVEPWKNLVLRVFEYYVDDAFNTGYGDVDYLHSLGSDLSLRVGVQYTDQRSVGGDRLGAFETWVVAGRAAVAYAGFTLTGAFAATGEGADIRTPFGTYPGYVKLIQKDFNRAGEKAWAIRLDYDLARLGIPGLSALAAVARGVDAVDLKTGRPAPDRTEYNVDATYRPPTGTLRGFSFRVRLALLDQSGSDHLGYDVRLIVNYELPLL